MYCLAVIHCSIIVSQLYSCTTQATYTLSRSNLWKYLQRITPVTTTAFHTLDEEVATQFIPALFGSYDIRGHDVVSLPTAFGGLGLEAPSTTANSAYAARQATTHLCAAIKGQEP
eukprot:GHVR01082979.1.p1 GENE.GHVR01082979.1~~GHVR01082979.1.p1  ORF type:complete len:115 (+),score=0.42 GHVR01082979.1:425-769(+)